MNANSIRRAGRPSSNTRIEELNIREEILSVSSNLFSEFGFKATSTREIAEYVGIRQPSLFHHFKRKEDILASLVEQGGRELLAYVDTVDYLSDASVSLYRLVLVDCLFLMTEPYQIGKLMSLPEIRNGKLKSLVNEKKQIVYASYRRLVETGVAQSCFIDIDSHHASCTLIGMTEALWVWCDRSIHSDFKVISQDVADMALRSLLVDHSHLNAIRKTSMKELGW